MAHRDSWPDVVTRLASCRVCREDQLLEQGARPLFCRFSRRVADLLFVFEAPNYGDTFDPRKGYLTYDADTDPSGRFFRELCLDVLQEPIDRIVVTNAVLCLPSGGKGRYPVKAAHLKNCSGNLRDQILALDPLVVATMGSVALDAARRLEDHGARGLNSAVAQPRGWLGRTLFPLFHTGMLARNGPTGRRADQQREDWARLRDVLRDLRHNATARGRVTE